MYELLAAFVVESFDVFVVDIDSAVGNSEIGLHIYYFDPDPFGTSRFFELDMRAENRRLVAEFTAGRDETLGVGISVWYMNGWCPHSSADLNNFRANSGHSQAERGEGRDFRDDRTWSTMPYSRA